MKKIWSRLSSALPHICIICAGMMLVFLVIEIINPHAGFISHAYTRIILWAWTVSTVLTAILLIAAQRKEFRRKERQRRKREEERRFNAEKEI